MDKTVFNSKQHIWSNYLTFIPNYHAQISKYNTENATRTTHIVLT